MSTDFRALTTIQVEALFDGRLEQFGVHEHFPSSKMEPGARILADGSNFLWAYQCPKVVTGFSSYAGYAGNNPCRILAAIEEVFEVEIVSEHDPRYWGFDTQEEWEIAMDKMEKERADSFYLELLKYLGNEPNDLQAGTNEIVRAEIGARLVADNPELLLLENRPALEKAIARIFDQQLRKDVPF